MPDPHPDTSREEELLGRLSSQVASRFGLHIPRKRWGALRKALQGFGQELGCATPEDCALRLLEPESPSESLLDLASRVTVGETYFFRDQELLASLEEQFLVPLVEARRSRDQHLRIMSAGCSTGEEVYTLAILLRRLLPDLADWKITILGADVNERALDKARAGLYSAWSFRRGAVPSPAYFLPEAGRNWRVRPELRAMVSFLRLNLAEAAYPSVWNNTTGLDLVLCRNVLMYFVPEVAAAALGRLRDCLAPGGRLVLGASEVVLAKVPGLEPAGYVGILARTGPWATVPAPLQPAPAPEALPGASPEMPQPPAPPDSPLWSEAVPEPSAPAVPDREDPPAEHPGPPPDPAVSAREHYLAGRYAQAVAAAEAAIRSFAPATSVGWLQSVRILALSLANLREYSRADRAVQQAIAGDKLNPHLRYLRASILLEEDPGLRLAEAREELRRALYLDDRYVPAHFLLGKLAREEGRETTARKHFSNARSIVAGLARDHVLEGGEGMTAGGMAALLDAIAPLGGKP